ncbi:MAG: cell division protein FtsW [Rhodospirillaceae bacterium]|nr:cell division protein FtsW [Rhodospirillaceae bacterium]
MRTLARTDTSVIGKWWWTVDRWSLGVLILLLLFGVLMIFTASPAVATKINLGSYHFVQRHLTLVPAGIAVIILVSLISPKNVRRLALLGLVISLILLSITLMLGAEIKGARRWLSVAGFSLQASEFVKPFFAVVTAWMFSEWRSRQGFPGHWISISIYLLIICLLLAQPDLGQTVVISAVWFCQFFLAGLPLVLVVSFIGLGIAGLVGTYFSLEHVRSRIDRFLDPSTGDTYQIDRSLEAFANGGFVGTGPGEGEIKVLLPDAHTDFVFVVTGEEFGVLVALTVLGLFGYLVLRGYLRIISESNLFVFLAAAGLLTQFGLQALIHMASSLQLIPAKGMTLPFISYGGSSFLALSIGMGMLLSLTRRRPGREGVV